MLLTKVCTAEGLTPFGADGSGLWCRRYLRIDETAAEPAAAAAAAEAAERAEEGGICSCDRGTSPIGREEAD